MADYQVDIQENDIFEFSPELLGILLTDRTLSTDSEQVNIFWATDNYAKLGKGYQYNDKITIESITGTNGNVIVPRALKPREQQRQRSRKMAEIFTPSWICNKQNNLIDNVWFDREDVFNTEIDDAEIIKAEGLPGNAEHSWIVNKAPITFPEGKTWFDYVKDIRLEITCGEAPYLVSRYDTVSGEYIPLDRRIGIIDRKLRVVSENTRTSEEWISAANAAFKSTYGFEWQGDSIILARETLLYTFIDCYQSKFQRLPDFESIRNIAEIISWNIWQMDGLKGVIPNSCAETRTVETDLFGKTTEKVTQCKGCKNKDIRDHNGRYCHIMDWEANKQITFVSLIKDKAV